MSQSTKLTSIEISELLDGELIGDPNTVINQISAIEDAEEGSITFLSNPKYNTYLNTTKASLILLKKGFDMREINNNLLIVDDPYVSFCVLQEHFQRQLSLDKKGRENPIFIGEDSRIGDHAYIGAFSYIGKSVKIGNHVKIYPQVHIGDHCEIGDHVILYPGVKLYERTVIGNFSTVHAGAVIGSHGFGFAPKSDGTYQKIPQTGHVVLGNHVDIGANTTIDCATLGVTKIDDGVKIDNLVQIAHNVKVGENTVIAAQTGISGSTSVGKDVLIGGQVGTVGHIHIADSTKVGARSGVTKNTKSDQVLFGVPAMDRNGYLKSYAIYKKLPEVMKRIQELEQKLLTLAASENTK